MNLISQAIADQSFIRTVLVLLVTAILTGVLVPLVKGRMDDRKLRAQKLFEAELARQSKVIESQVALLERLAELLLRFQFSCLEVSYYGSRFPGPKYVVAFDKYDKESWEFFVAIGTEIGKSQRLVSPGIYAVLKAFNVWMIEIDNRIYALNAKSATVEEWEKHHDRVFEEGSQRIDRIIGLLAKELRLEAPTRR